MITSAGKLSRTTSQGSPSRSAMRNRPITRPIAEPIAMAATNATVTRSSVAPRLKASAPERVSLTSAIATACGSGSMRAPARCEAIVQAATSRTSETIRAATLFLRPVERAAVKLPRRSYQLGPANLGEHQIEGTGISLLLGNRALPNSFGVALAIDRERLGVAHADPRRQALPLGFAHGENRLGL